MDFDKFRYFFASFITHLAAIIYFLIVYALSLNFESRFGQLKKHSFEVVQLCPPMHKYDKSSI